MSNQTLDFDEFRQYFPKHNKYEYLKKLFSNVYIPLSTMCMIIDDRNVNFFLKNVEIFFTTLSHNLIQLNDNKFTYHSILNSSMGDTNIRATDISLTLYRLPVGRILLGMDDVVLPCIDVVCIDKRINIKVNLKNVVRNTLEKPGVFSFWLQNYCDVGLNQSRDDLLYMVILLIPLILSISVEVLDIYDKIVKLNVPITKKLLKRLSKERNGFSEKSSLYKLQRIGNCG